MRIGMGNLLETDSDVASVSDNERERTEGDGMESEIDGLSSANNTKIRDTKSGEAEEISGSSDPVPASSNSIHDVTSHTPSISQSEGSSSSTKILCSDEAQGKSPTTGSPGFNKLVAVSPRELPPRNQLIQVKPTMTKPKISSRASAESVDGVNKQKNPRFIPYEPYRGAVRPMVAQENSSSSKRHSRSTSDASASSIGLEQAMGSISLNSDSEEVRNAQEKDNAHNRSTEGQKVMAKDWSLDIPNQLKKRDQIIEKQTHALTFLKERLKIAERDNNDLHRENIRLKKLLVDSLSGDIFQTHEVAKVTCSTKDSDDTLSNEIEVWRSKFLSSCVLVEQLTRENGTLNETVGAASNILKEVKLTSSLSPSLFEEVNVWLRTNRGITIPQNNNISDVCS